MEHQQSFNYAKAIIETIKPQGETEVVSIYIETAILSWHIPKGGLAIIEGIYETLRLLPRRLAYAEYYTKIGYIDAGVAAVAQARALLEQQWDTLKAAEAEAALNISTAAHMEISTVRFGPLYPEESLRSLEQLSKRDIHCSIAHIQHTLLDIETFLRDRTHGSGIIPIKVRLLMLFCESIATVSCVAANFIRPTVSYIDSHKVLCSQQFEEERRRCEGQLINHFARFTTDYALARIEFTL